MHEARAGGADPEVGSWLTLAVNGLDALRTLDLHRSVLACGDPASPSPGQGASMAIEDAVELARCVRDTKDIPAGLATQWLFEHHID